MKEPNLYQQATATAATAPNSTYAGVIWGSRAHVIACSGAVTHDIFGRQKSGDSKEVPQILKLRAEAVGPESPQAVLLSIGGNDVGFASTAIACVEAATGAGSSDRDRPAQRADHRARCHARPCQRGRPGRLPGAQGGRCRGQRQAGIGPARRPGRRPILVMPYPRIVPSTATAVSSCMFGISGEEIGDVNQFLGALNNSVALASYHLRNQGRPVYFVDDVIESFQPDHTICEGDTLLREHGQLVEDPGRQHRRGAVTTMNCCIPTSPATGPRRVRWSPGRAAGSARPVKLEGRTDLGRGRRRTSTTRRGSTGSAEPLLDFVTGPVGDR